MISVVIPIWNRCADLLDRTLYTLVNQSMLPHEIIVSDTSSIKKYTKDVRSAASKYETVQHIHSPLETFSLSRSFNVGIRNTYEKSEYILCSGAEMLFSSEFLEKLFVSMDDTRFAVGCCGFLPKDTEYPDNLAWSELSAQVIPNTFRKMSPGAFQCASRSWWFKVRGYDEKLPFAFVDTNILQCSRTSGLKRIVMDYDTAQTLHQWHEPSELVKKLGGELEYALDTKVIRNLDGWGI